MYRQTPLVVFHLLFSFMRSPIIEHNSIFFQFVSTLSFSFWLIIFWLLKMITSSPEAVKQFWVFIDNFFPPEIEFSVALIGVKMTSVPEKMITIIIPSYDPKGINVLKRTFYEKMIRGRSQKTYHIALS